MTTIACVYEQENIRAEDYSPDLLAEYILDKARVTQARIEQLSKELVSLEQEKIFYYEKKVEELDCEVQNRRRLENFYREVTVGFMPKFKALLDPRLIQDMAMAHETEEAYNLYLMELSVKQMSYSQRALVAAREQITSL